MIFYRAFQPLLLGVYASLAFILKHVPILSRKTEKFWRTFDIRYVQGVPAFIKIDRAVFNGERPVWIHAASGEFEYAKPVIRELAKAGKPVLVTYFSPTFADNVRKFPGVSAAFAIQAGRELRVIANANQTTDAQALQICRDIARAIEQELDYPGEIKVTVIRETRNVEMAK